MVEAPEAEDETASLADPRITSKPHHDEPTTGTASAEPVPQGSRVTPSFFFFLLARKLTDLFFLQRKRILTELEEVNKLQDPEPSAAASKPESPAAAVSSVPTTTAPPEGNPHQRDSRRNNMLARLDDLNQDLGDDISE